MSLKLPRATDDADALSRIAERLNDDVGYLLRHCIEENKYIFWAISRSLFPIAESLAYLLVPGVTSTSERLSTFLKDSLGKQDPKYKDVAHIVCQMWRHGLTHGDETPALTLDDLKSISWKVILPPADEHLFIKKIDADNALLSFSLASFYNHLLTAAQDPTNLSLFTAGDIRNRYNDWTVKTLTLTSGSKEEKKAAQEIARILP